VPRDKHDVTIRGVDRAAVVLDGEDTRRTGVVVHADGVSILNLSAHNFPVDGFRWEDADDFRASYLTVWNVGQYGIYTEESEHGTIDHDYVSGAADAAYYVGECRRCSATIANVVATLSAVGYSGTNASGLIIRDSRWTWNGAGIVPNTYANEEDPPEERATIVRNTVTGSGRVAVPINTPLAGFFGIGIAIAGGNDNAVRANRVRGSERYGIAVYPTARRIAFTSPVARDPGPPWRPSGNVVSRNTVTGSGRADLALANGVGPGNCFRANTERTSVPSGLDAGSCTRAGDAAVTRTLTAGARKMFEAALRQRRPPEYTEMPKPPAQPNLP
jgi:parallel beta helix pectate lyase-like protein